MGGDFAERDCVFIQKLRYRKHPNEIVDYAMEANALKDFFFSKANIHIFWRFV